jgi:hypothetical protein
LRVRVHAPFGDLSICRRGVSESKA